jgi:WD40 repeat protein
MKYVHNTYIYIYIYIYINTCVYIYKYLHMYAITGKVVFNLRKEAQPVYSIAPSPTGDFIATGSLGGFVSVWSLKDGSLAHESKGSGDTFDVSSLYMYICKCKHLNMYVYICMYLNIYIYIHIYI